MRREKREEGEGKRDGGEVMGRRVEVEVKVERLDGGEVKRTPEVHKVTEKASSRLRGRFLRVRRATPTSTGHHSTRLAGRSNNLRAETHEGERMGNVMRELSGSIDTVMIANSTVHMTPFAGMEVARLPSLLTQIYWDL